MFHLGGQVTSAQEETLDTCISHAVFKRKMKFVQMPWGSFKNPSRHTLRVAFELNPCGRKIPLFEDVWDQAAMSAKGSPFEDAIPAVPA